MAGRIGRAVGQLVIRSTFGSLDERGGELACLFA